MNSLVPVVPATPDDAPDSIDITPDFLDSMELACRGGYAGACDMALMRADEDTRTELLISSCLRGHDRACSNLENVVAGGSVSLPDLHDRCNDSQGAICYTLGRAYLLGYSVAVDLPLAYNYFRRGCQDGALSACTSAGVMNANAEGVPQSFERAFGLYFAACQGGNPTGCSNLGSMYLLGQFVAQDLDRARELFEFACFNGDSEGCGRLQLVEQGFGL